MEEREGRGGGGGERVEGEALHVSPNENFAVQRAGRAPPFCLFYSLTETTLDGTSKEKYRCPVGVTVSVCEVGNLWKIYGRYINYYMARSIFLTFFSLQ